MEFIVLDLDQATEEQLIATIDCNNRTSRLMSSEIEKLKRVAESAKKTKRPIEVEPEQPAPQQPQPVVDQDFENEIEYYYSQVKELKLANIEEDIVQALPSRKHYQYTRILTRLKLESIRAIKEIKDLIAEEGISVEDMTAFKDELELELKKIELLDKHLQPLQAEELKEEPQENNLIFVPTSGGDIRILDELDSIPSEYYDKFNGLFQSIKDGTFKNVQRFSRNSELAGLCEVKDFKVRVLFVRLNRDSYAVISSFIKKTDNDKGYRSALVRKYTDYQLVEDDLIRNLSNPEFMQLHKEYEQELFRKLSPTSSKETPITKKKGGEA